MIKLRPISWLRGAQKDFEAFPKAAQLDALTALSIAARGGKADTAKPFKGVDGGVCSRSRSGIEAMLIE